MSRLVVAAAALAVSVTAAIAEPAVTLRSATVYDGPGRQFPAITVIPPGVEVDVIGCSRGWCAVEWDDDEGFVLERLLDFYGAAPLVVVFPPIVYQYGWGYWRRNYGVDWQRWRQRYGRPATRPYVSPPRAPRQPGFQPGPGLQPSRPGQPGAAPPGGVPAQPRAVPGQRAAPQGGQRSAPRGFESGDSPGGPPAGSPGGFPAGPPGGGAPMQGPRGGPMPPR